MSINLNGNGKVDVFLKRSVSREINYLREQQKKLQASSARIEEMLKQMSGKQNPASVKPTSVPRELSVRCFIAKCIA